MPEVKLRTAIATYGHTAALKDRSVRPDGVDLDLVEVKPIIAAFRRMVRDVEFDVCEMAPATYMIAREHGSPFKALPVFIYRRFHHSGFVCRDDAGIREPKDLEGKKAGVRAWSVTTGIWTRGILQNEYGVDISKVTWYVDDEEHVQALRLPPNVVHAREGRSLAEMMEAGELHAAFTDNAGIGRAGKPTGDWQPMASKKSQSYRELFPNAAALDREWFSKTGIYPIHGLIVVKDEVLARAPWIAKSLYDAFQESKERYVKRLNTGESGMSDKDDHYRKMADVVGDPLPYGIESNRRSIEALMEYCHQQGLLERRYAIEDMFVECER